MNLSSSFRVLLFFAIILLRPYDGNNYDGVEGGELIWVFTRLGVLYYFLSVFILWKILSQLDFFVILAILPVIYLNSFELYNRFYFVIGVGLIIQGKPQVLGWVSHLYLVALQPLNAFLVLNKVRILAVISILLGIIHVFYNENVRVLLIQYSFLLPKINSVLSLIDGAEFVHEKGNLSLVNYRYNHLVGLLLPIVYFSHFISALYFQFLISIIASRGIRLLLIVILAFTIYTLLTPNLASFYRNFVPIWVILELKLKRNEDILCDY